MSLNKKKKIKNIKSELNKVAFKIHAIKKYEYTV